MKSAMRGVRTEVAFKEDARKAISFERACQYSLGSSYFCSAIADSAWGVDLGARSSIPYSSTHMILSRAIVPLFPKRGLTWPYDLAGLIL
jgi:hypothetical protein